MPYKGDKGDKNAARPPEGSLVETRCLIKGPKSAIVPFPGPRSGPKSRTGPGAFAGALPPSVEKGLLISREGCDTQPGRVNKKFPHKNECSHKVFF